MRLILPFLFIFSFSFIIYPQSYNNEYDIEVEISRVKREIERVNSERKEVKDAVKRDRQEFSEYEERIKNSVSLLKIENDSLEKDISVYTGRKDSLDSSLKALQAEKENYRIRRKHAVNVLISLCDSVKKAAENIPPSQKKEINSSLDFLRSELAAQKVDLTEGMSRLVRILNDTRTSLMNVEIASMGSPVSGISGQVRMLRIGGVFEAVVSQSGEKCALWDKKTGEWSICTDKKTAGNIQKAVKINEGDALPALVPIPYTREEESGEK